ncbi:hypothetical protein BH20ACI4_BH20ACI4_26220 [soil metagenome]
MKKFVLVFILVILSFAVAAAQKKAKYNYAAQKNFIPAELGKVYLGMPFDQNKEPFVIRH